MLRRDENHRLPSLRAEVETLFSEVRGRREIVREFGGSRIRLRERWSGAFNRSVELPGQVDEKGMTATLREGILRIELPRKDRRP